MAVLPTILVAHRDRAVLGTAIARALVWSLASLILGLFAPRDAHAVTKHFVTEGGIFTMVDGEIVHTYKCPDEYDEGPAVVSPETIAAAALCDLIIGFARDPPAPLTAKPLTSASAAVGAANLSAGKSIQAAPSANLNVIPELNASTPSLPFLGNPLVVLSYLPNASSNPTASYSLALRRQSNCSLTADFVLPHATTPETPNGDLIGSLPSAQDYFHQLSGLATSPNVFAQGCDYPILGLPSSKYGRLLGTTPGGAVIGASVAATTQGNLQITLVNGTANTFTRTILLSGSTHRNLTAIATADLNGDDNLDLVATFATDPANQQPSTVVLVSNGNGTFGAGAYYDVAGDITIDDVNGDGKPDIVVQTLATSGVTTLIGRGDGTFSIGPSSATGFSAFSQAAGQLLAADFNGDGKKDLLTNGVVLTGNGDGTFAVGTQIPGKALFNLASGVATSAAGDVNKDGKLDLIISQAGFVALYYGRGDGTFQAGPRYAALPLEMQVSITDIDGDGNPDIVLGNSTGGIYAAGCCGDVLVPPMFQILMGRGDGTFVDSLSYAQGTFGNGTFGVAGPQIANADFSGDGKLDLLVFNRNSNLGSPSSLVTLPGDGAGKLGTAIVSSINLGPSQLVAADINKDGKPDAVLAGNSLSATPRLSVLIGQGNGTFAGEQDYALANYPVGLATGDFNGDGQMDVAVGVAPNLGGSGTTGVYVLLGQAGGTLQAPVKIDASLSPTGIAAGDINGDGRADLVVADQGSVSYAGGVRQINYGVVHVYLGNADGTFSAAATPTTSATNYSVSALGDLNGDGKLDLVLGGDIAGATISSPSTPNAYTLLGNGDGTFKAATTTALVGDYPTSIAVADFNKDGRPDVAVGDASNFTGLLIGNGDGTFVRTLLVLGQRPQAMAAADLNADGFPELFVGTVSGSGSQSLAVFDNSKTWAASAIIATATSTTLAGSATSLGVGQSLTLTSTVAAASGTTIPTGTVTFLDGAATIGTIALDATGKAIFATSSLAQGAHTLRATYGGSTSFAASASSNVTVTVAAPAADFSVSVSPATLTVAAGQSGALTLTLAPLNGSTQTVTASCSGLPTNASCGFSPAASVTLNGTQPATIAIAIRTSVTAALIPLRTSPMVASFGGVGGLLLALVASGAATRRRARHMLLAVAAGVGIVSCGGGGGNDVAMPVSSATPAGNYPLTITLTSGAITHSVTATLTVQ